MFQRQNLNDRIPCVWLWKDILFKLIISESCLDVSVLFQLLTNVLIKGVVMMATISKYYKK